MMLCRASLTITLIDLLHALQCAELLFIYLNQQPFYRHLLFFDNLQQKKS
jgi:hypothetical protein